jgi:hypothetical protein
MEINNLKIGKERRPDDEVRAFFNASTAGLFFNFSIFIGYQCPAPVDRYEPQR